MSITVLIVDDEDNARQTISDYLTPLGYEVLGAANLAEARSYMQRATEMSCCWMFTA